ncbi:MAG: alpha/beta hydrolase [Acidimicrobiales bacterium]|nr:alpha/beta hydrolase [Acidimicrobiales bacterium]
MIESTDGVRVALHDLGGRGRPLLFLHATGFHGRCYQQIANHLHDDYHVFAPDLRGHGDSETPDMALPWRGMADDVEAVLDHLALDGPIPACGHSMGGATVVATALRRPQAFRAAWIFEPILFPSVHETRTRENPLAEGARRRRHHFDSIDEIIERYASKPPFDAVDPAALRDYVVHGFRARDDGVTLKTTGENEARTFEGVDTSVFERLSEITMPVTVVGSGDGMPPAVVAPQVADALPHGVLTPWPDRTHFGPFEDPARAAADIRRALGEQT